MESLKPTEAFKNSFRSLKPYFKEKNQNQFFIWAITIFSFVIPLFFLPFTLEFYTFNKTFLLYFIIIILLLAWLVKIFFQQEIKILKANLNWPVVAVALIFLLSTFIQAPNSIETLIKLSGRILAAGLLYFMIINHFRGRKSIAKIFTALIASSVVLAGLTIFASLGLLEKLGPAWLQTKTWTPTGSPLITLELMLVLLPGTLYWSLKTKAIIKKILLFIAVIFQILAIASITMLVSNKTLVLPYLTPNFGWQISVEGLKTLRSGLLGVGPGNFLSAFNRFRPLGLNNTVNWAVKFANNSNQYLDLLSTVGLLGLVSYVWVMLVALKRENFKGSLIGKVVYIALLTSFLVQFLITPGFLVILVTFIFLALIEVNQTPLNPDSGYEHQIKLPFVVWSTIGLIAVLAFLTFYWGGRSWLADYYFKQSLVAAEQNKGVETYNLQIKAIRFDPWQESYRLVYSNTNLALANSLASQTDLTDQKKANIGQLVSQAVQEAKAAISLNPQISNYWINLANIYRALIGANKDAEQWTAAALVEAIRTDPTNPLLRVDFGGLFYGLKNYDQAVSQFQQAASLKPDYANAYYNLAAAYKAKEDWQNAYLSLQTTLSLIPEDSSDYNKAKTELEEVKAKLPQEPQAQTKPEEVKKEPLLNPPSPLASPQPQMGEVKLPKELGPEIPKEATKSGR